MTNEMSFHSRVRQWFLILKLIRYVKLLAKPYWMSQVSTLSAKSPLIANQEKFMYCFQYYKNLVFPRMGFSALENLFL